MKRDFSGDGDDHADDDSDAEAEADDDLDAGWKKFFGAKKMKVKNFFFRHNENLDREEFLEANLNLSLRLT